MEGFISKFMRLLRRLDYFVCLLAMTITGIKVIIHLR